MESKTPSNKQTVKVWTDQTLSEFLVDYPKDYSGDQLVEIIFFHGLQLGDESLRNPHLTTWSKRSVPDEYWPSELFAVDDLLTDKKIKVRAFTAAYDSSKRKSSTGGRLDLYNIAENFMQAIIGDRRVNVGQSKNVPVILVGHSFGGVVLKELMLHASKGASRDKKAEKFLNNVKGVFYYSTPHIALSKDVHGALFPPNKNQYSSLELFFKELNKEISRQKADMERLVEKHRIQVFSVFESQETDLGNWKGQILAEGSGRDSVAENAMIEDADHLNICKIDSVTSPSYRKLANFIYSILNPTE